MKFGANYGVVKSCSHRESGDRKIMKYRSQHRNAMPRSWWKGQGRTL